MWRSSCLCADASERIYATIHQRPMCLRGRLQRVITGTEYNPGLNQYDPLNEMSSIPGLHSCKVLTFPFLSSPGGHHPNHEDEEADQQRPAADGAGGDPEEHVSASEKDDKRADRVAHRAQIHKEGRGGHQHLHLHGLGSEDGVCVLLFFTTGLHLAR